MTTGRSVFVWQQHIGVHSIMGALGNVSVIGMLRMMMLILA